VLSYRRWRALIPIRGYWPTQDLRGPLRWFKLVIRIRKTMVVPESARPFVERMRLDHPQDANELLLQRTIVYALTSVDAI
jgi:hypothetical protein